MLPCKGNRCGRNEQESGRAKQRGDELRYTRKSQSGQLGKGRSQVYPRSLTKNVTSALSSTSAPTTNHGLAIHALCAPSRIALSSAVSTDTGTLCRTRISTGMVWLLPAATTSSTAPGSTNPTRRRNYAGYAPHSTHANGSNDDDILVVQPDICARAIIACWPKLRRWNHNTRATEAVPAQRALFQRM